MQKIFTLFILLLITGFSFGQVKKIELFDLIKKFVQDSAKYDVSGDWSVGHPATFPVKWQADRIEMSDDEKINFFRKGTADITLNGRNFTGKWTVMLMGPRSGFSSFSIASPNISNFRPRQTIDSLFPKKLYSYQLLISCDASSGYGFYYYQIKIPKKVTSWLKVSWLCKEAGCTIILDCYDDWSKQYANLACLK